MKRSLFFGTPIANRTHMGSTSCFELIVESPSRPTTRQSYFRDSMKIACLFLLSTSLHCLAKSGHEASPIQIETVLNSTSSWDGTPYRGYPHGQPLLAVLKYTIAPHTTMKWPTHPMPNVGYILSVALTVERKDGTKKQFVAGQALAEMVDSEHRGTTGENPVVLLVFYPDIPGLALSK